jgi:hypothetical protein
LLQRNRYAVAGARIFIGFLGAWAAFFAALQKLARWFANFRNALRSTEKFANINFAMEFCVELHGR